MFVAADIIHRPETAEIWFHSSFILHPSSFILYPPPVSSPRPGLLRSGTRKSNFLSDTQRLNKPNGVAVPLSDGGKVIRELF